MQKFTLAVLVILLALGSLAEADSAQNQEVAPGLVVGQTATVQGLVRFEEHHTVIPLSLCSAQGVLPCVRSRTYWSLVIYTDNNQFEVDERFNVDQVTPPNSIELDGQTIRPGQVIRVEATVEYAGSNYFILGNVRDVSTVFDYSTVSFPNWSCQGTVDSDTQIEVQVSYTGAVGGSEGDLYNLQLQGAENSPQSRRIFPLAALNDAQAFSSRDQLVYQGQSANANVELVIDDSPNAMDLSDSPVQGHLKFSLAHLPSQHSQIQAQGEFPVTCGRIR